MHELRNEVARRRKDAEIALDGYMKEKEPVLHSFGGWIFIVNFILALFATVLLTQKVVPEMGHWTPIVHMFLGAVLFFMFLSPSLILNGNENRVRRRFDAEYPEHADALRS